MIRVALIAPPSTDADITAHADTIAELDDVDLTRRDAPTEDRLAYILRTAADLFRRSSEFDVLVTAGRAALTAAKVGWRGPIIHLPVGRMTASEVTLARGLAKRGLYRLVTTSSEIARQATHHVAYARHIHVIEPDPRPSALTRTAARAKLGIADDQTLVYLPGFARPGSNHRLALWAANILYFRDPKVRVLIVRGGPRDDFVRRFVTSAELWPAIASDGSLNDADRAEAADVAICTADSAPDIAPLIAAARSGTPIVGLRSTWQREGLDAIAATLAAEPKARLVARAALDAMEEPPVRLTAVPAERSDSAWSDVLRSIRR